MGSSNLNCAVTNFPIDREEKVKCIFLIRTDSSRKAPYYPWGEWQFASLPIEVTMGDYSTPLGVLDECAGSESGDFDVKTDFEKWMYNLFVDRVFVYSQNGKKPVADKKEHAGDNRHHWYHIARYGDYNLGVGWCDRYDPERLAKLDSNPPKDANLNLMKSFYTFDPDDIAVMFINQEAFKYLTVPRPLRGDGKDYFKEVDEMFALIRKYVATPETDRTSREDMRMEMTGSRYEFFNNRMWGRILNVMRQGQYVDEVEKTFKQLYCMSYNLWNAQVPIRPSHGLAPQCGWHNDMKQLVNWQKKLLTIAQKRSKREE
jgi:hypothetical protein